MNNFKVTQLAHDAISISYEDLQVEIYSYTSCQRPGVTFWNYHPMDEDIGGELCIDEAIAKATERLKSIIAEYSRGGSTTPILTLTGNPEFEHLENAVDLP